MTDFGEQAIDHSLLLCHDVAEVVERGFLVLETDFEFDNGLGHAVLPRGIKGSKGFVQRLKPMASDQTSLSR